MIKGDVGLCNVQAIEIALDEDDMAQLITVSRLPIEYPSGPLGS
ncbi:hypothetical protein [Pelagibacterium montanilacus]|nr:hypothetical protein [Pelagibacterium montanilacus]